MTSLPDWFQSEIWALITGSASIWRLDLGGPEDRRVGREPVDARLAVRSGSFRAATQAIMFGRPLGIIGWSSRNSGFAASGSGMIT